MAEQGNDEIMGRTSAASIDARLASTDKYIIEGDSDWLSRKETYHVKDGSGASLCAAVREGTFYKGIAVVGFLFILSILLMMMSSLGRRSALFEFTLIGVCLAALIALAAVMLRPRHTFVYRLDSECGLILKIVHYKVYMPFIGSYMIRMADEGEVLGYLRRNSVLNAFRAKMKCYGPDGSNMCECTETASVAGNALWWILSISGSQARVVGEVQIVEPTESRVIGKFSGQTIELAPEGHIDGRVLLAMGLMICSEMRVV
jgi:hypothetical protein